jgi:nucleoside 2-deoxyribosyltransferase
MKVYIASTSTDFAQAKLVALVLKSMKHTITREWWNFKFSAEVKCIEDEKWYKHHVVRNNAEEDFKAIEECDAFVLVGQRNKTTHFRGANIELGYAYALKKPCFAIGNIERCTLYSRLVFVYTMFALVKKLDALKPLATGNLANMCPQTAGD